MKTFKTQITSLVATYHNYMNRIPIVAAYKNYMKSHPFVLQSIQTGVLMGAGDMLAQMGLEKKGIFIDWHRTFTYTLTGFFVVGPAVSRWYLVMERLYGPKKDVVTTIKKVATDQFVFAPGFLPIFITVVTLLQTKSFDAVKEEVWPLIQLINFYFTPLNYRLLVTQTIALFWNAYLSFTIK